MEYEIINAIQYNKELLNLAHQAVKIRHRKYLTLDDIFTLFRYVTRSKKIPRTNLWTLHYIRENFDFAEGGRQLFDQKLEILNRE